MSGGVPAGELLPCPFCGGTDGRLVQGFTRATDNFAFWSVECLDCGAEIADDESQEAADRHWNTRATPTPPIEGRDADVEREISLAEAARDLLDAQKRLGPAVAFRLDLWACLEANLEGAS